MPSIARATALTFSVLATANAALHGLQVGSGGQTIHGIKREAAAAQAEGVGTLAKRQDSEDEELDLELLYPEHNLSIPIDHYHNESRYEPHSDDTFPNRYWFDAQFYKPGGPVIVLQSGETSGVGRLPFLRQGIVYQLAKATGGIGVILEHRYYGTSFPTEDLSTENLRFLTTQQALMDQKYFAENVQFPGMEDMDLTSASTPWIAYGGSYAGAFVAFLRVQFPGTFWGAISSSGVTVAKYDFPEYYDPVAQYGPPACIAAQRSFIDIADSILIGQNDDDLIMELKEAFGMPNVTEVDDFANQLGAGISAWQSLNWDPEVGSDEFYSYCNNITSMDVLYPEQESKRSTVEMFIEQADYNADEMLVNQMLNYIGYINLTTVSACDAVVQDECFGNHNSTYYEQDSLDDTWRAWPYQYCTEWGYLQTGESVSEDQMPVISRAVTLEYTTIICREAFNITSPPNVEEVNKFGGYDINYPRLAIIDGEWDPWRPVTPHGFQYGAEERESTASEPFMLIPEALHHYDENGRLPNETVAGVLPPPEVADAQVQLRQAVESWLMEWQLHCQIEGGCTK